MCCYWVYTYFRGFKACKDHCDLWASDLGEHRCNSFSGPWWGKARNRDVDETASKIDERGDQTCVFSPRKQRLQKHDLPEDRLPKQPHVKEYVGGCAVLNDVDAEAKPTDQTDNRINESVVGEPTEPVGSVCHSHHSHTFLGLGLLFFDNLERYIVNRQHVDQKQEERKEARKHCLKLVDDQFVAGNWWRHNVDACSRHTSGGLKNLVCDDVLDKRVSILSWLVKSFYVGIWGGGTPSWCVQERYARSCASAKLLLVVN